MNKSMNREMQGHLSKKEPWEMTQAEMVGEKPKVAEFARMWNEEAFFLSYPEPESISNIIHEGGLKKTYWKEGLDGTVLAKNQYAVGKDKKYSRILLLSRLVDNKGSVLVAWDAIGEYDGGNIGIAEAYRGEGAGTAFVKELMRQGKIQPSIGYSPEGLKTIKKAHKELIQEALSESKPVPEEVLRDYPELVKPKGHLRR